jgi:hypothetical protein
MRKTLLVITVLLVAAQAYAGTVTLSVDNVSVVMDRWAAIRYSSDADVSAFGLKVTADSGAIFTDIKDYNVGECTATVQGYGIFPGTIDINEDTGVVDDNGTPVAPNTAPGASGTGFGTSTLILEMGALYEDGNAPALTGTLISVKVTGDCNVCVEGEPIRGNVVLTDGNPAVLDPCTACGGVAAICQVPDVVGDPNLAAQAEIIANGFGIGDITTAYSDTVDYDNVISTDPAAGAQPGCGTDVNMVVSLGSDCYLGMPQADIDEWISVGRPVCWCYPRQCIGDADGRTPQTKAPYYWVTDDDLTILKSGWMKTVAQMSGDDICADIDRDSPQTKAPYYRVTDEDLTILKANWMVAGLPVSCSPGNRTP